MKNEWKQRKRVTRTFDSQRCPGHWTLSLFLRVTTSHAVTSTRRRLSLDRAGPCLSLSRRQRAKCILHRHPQLNIYISQVHLLFPLIVRHQKVSLRFGRILLTDLSTSRSCSSRSPCSIILIVLQNHLDSIVILKYWVIRFWIEKRGKICRFSRQRFAKYTGTAAGCTHTLACQV